MSDHARLHGGIVFFERKAGDPKSLACEHNQDSLQKLRAHVAARGGKVVQAVSYFGLTNTSGRVQALWRELKSASPQAALALDELLLEAFKAGQEYALRTKK